MPSSSIPSPQPGELGELLVPLLAAFPAGAATGSSTPPAALLPVLSPILRQRVQLLASADSSPWLSLLCYDSAHAAALSSLAADERFEPHPVSGEVEVDWDLVEASYKRVDAETLQSRLALPDLGLSVRLIWCVNDEGSDGWRVGEVGVWDPLDVTWGYHRIAEAEEAFKTLSTQAQSAYNRTKGIDALLAPGAEAEADEDDDDGYWAQYDGTPARTPAPTKRSPAPPPQASDPVNGIREEEEDYYARYARVQPAMDHHDPDEEVQINGAVESTLGHDGIATNLLRSSHPRNDATDIDIQIASRAWSDVPMIYTAVQSDPSPQVSDPIAHPRTRSSTGSSGSHTVARLERRVAAGENSEAAIKRHIGSSVKSLYRLARAAGIDREEFERMIRTELECLALMDDEEV